MTASLPAVFSVQQFTDAGAPAASYRLYTYVPSTTTQKVAYTDAAASTPHSYTSDGVGGSYIALNGRGELPASLYLTSGGYDLCLKTSAGATVWTRYAVGSADSSAAIRADLASAADAAKGAALSGFGPTLNYTAKTLGAATQDGAINLLWFCTEAQRAAIKAKTYADDHTALLAAAVSYGVGRAIYMPAGGYKVSSYTITQAGQKIFGDGMGATVIRATDATQHLFSVTAHDVTICEMELQGAAVNGTNTTFAVFTATATAPKRMRVNGVKFSGATSASGFNSGIKFDDGCIGGEVVGCHFEYLQGSASGRGYGVLVGAASAVKIARNNWYGSSGRGRHAYYLSAGASRCVVESNLADSPDYEGITIFSQNAQPPCTDNIVARNIVVSASQAQATLNGSGVSVFGHALRNKIIHNIITSAAGCGIKLDGTGVTDHKGNEIIGNTITNAGFIGVDAIANVGGVIGNNTITDSSQSSAGAYANIRLVAEPTNTTGCSNIAIVGNRIPASATARCAVQLNATLPVPVGITIAGNLVGSGTATDYELLSGGQAVDGRIRFSTAYDPASIANGAALTSTYTVAGAAVGDLVAVTHTSDTDGCSLTARVSVTDAVKVSILNNSGGAKDIATGTLYLDVWKRT